MAMALAAPASLAGCGQSRKDGHGPDVRFIGPSAAKPGETFLFDARSTVEKGLKMSHRWDFGDGTNEIISFDPTAEHTFLEAGTFGVTLTVTDDVGNVGELTHNVLISDEYVGCDIDVDCEGDGDFSHTHCVDSQCFIRPHNVTSDGS